MSIRRVVTGYGSDGTGLILFDGPAPSEIALPAEVGASLTDLWRSNSLPLDTTDVADPTEGTFEVMPSGSLFRIIDFAPGEHAPMWHTTASVDFIYVAAGEITLLYENESLKLSAGDTAVQRGINHAWVNQASSPCRLINVSVPATLPAPSP